MAKRARGTGRPGQHAPLQRSRRRPDATGAASARIEPPPSTAPPPSASTTGARRLRTGLTEDEEARAAQLEAAILAEERAAEEATRRNRDRTRTAPVGPREAAPLTVRAAEEYAYVRRDIIRIARVGTVLLLILAVLHVLINVMGLVRV